MKKTLLTLKEKKEIKSTIVRKNLFRTMLRYSIMIGVLILGITVFTLDMFNFGKDTFSFTNYGFAVMASYSALCFSWARNLNAEEKKTMNKINWLALSALYGGITFILGSTFKYIYVLRKEELQLFGWDISMLIKYLSIICLFYSVLMFCAVSLQLLKAVDKYYEEKLRINLTERIKSKKLNEEIEKELMEVLDKYIVKKTD